MRWVKNGRMCPQQLLVRTVTMVLVAYLPLWSFAQLANEQGASVKIVQSSDDTQPEVTEKPNTTVEPDTATTDISQAAEKLAGAEVSDEDEIKEPLLAKYKVEPARLGGIQPGTSRPEDTNAEWGEPTKVVQNDGVEQRLYSVEPFEQVVTTVENGVVASIVVNLNQPFSPDEVATQLALDEFRPVVVRDTTGKPLGQVYPERGVLFGFDPEAEEPAVIQIILEPIDAQTFIARAENQQIAQPQASLNDLEVAEHLAPSEVKTYALRASILYRVGIADRALTAVNQAIELEADNPASLLTRAKIAMELGDYELAAEDLQKTLKLAGQGDLIRAQAILQKGNLFVHGPDRDLKQAIEFHLQAIKLAEPLLADEYLAVQHAAEDVSIEAHLAVAYDVAHGNWRRQESVVPMWLDRATQLADATSSGRLRLRRQITISRGALQASIGLGGELDHQGYVLQSLRAAKQLLVNSTDTLDEHALQLTMGLLLSDAVRIAQLRGLADEALKNGIVAADYIELARASLGEQPRFAFYESQLMFRIGSVHALQKENHTVAVEYFDRSFPLIKEALPFTPPAEVGQQGEALVSMAVSYWEVEDRDLALRLTNAGAQLMEEAVGSGLMEAEALEVPYTNLASMHRHLGNEDEASQFERMATRPNESETQ